MDTCSNILFQNHGHYYGVGSPFPAIATSPLLGRLSARCSNTAAGTCFHSATSITEVGHWCWAIRPGSQSVFQFIPKVFDGFEVKVLCRPVKFFHTDPNKRFLYVPLLFARGNYHTETAKGLPKLLPQSWKHRMSLYAVALRFPLTGTKGPSLNNEKQSQNFIPPPTNITVGTMHLQLTGSALAGQSIMFLDLPYCKCNVHLKSCLCLC
jgi:hypothetical protein